MSSPSKSVEVFSDGANDFYDAELTAAINNKMRVPDKIKLVQGNMMNGTSDILQDPAFMGVKNENAEWMRVPDRICVVGGESHIAARPTPPEFELEHSFLGKATNDYEQIVQLATPPSTLRIEDTSPVFDTPVKQLTKALKSMEGGRTATKSAENRMNDSLMDYEDSELNSQNYLHLRRRLLQITQRLDSLEIENSRRNKRDFLLYTIGFLYILFRGVNFFAGRNQF